MTWVKVCDGFDTDRRVEDVSLAAAGLFIRSASYSARYLLDGRIDERWVRRRVPNARQREKLVAELVFAGLWRSNESGGYDLVPLLDGDVDPLLNHFTAAEVKEHRRKEAQKKRAQRDRKRGGDPEGMGSVPEGHTGDSPARPRSGRLGQGSGEVGRPEPPSESFDPWALTDEERIDSNSARAEPERPRPTRETETLAQDSRRPGESEWTAHTAEAEFDRLREKGLL